MMVFDKNLAVVESIQVWDQSFKKEERTWRSKVSVFDGK